MRPAARLALLPISLALSSLPAMSPLLARTASAASFNVRDTRSEREISERTDLFVDGRLAATFRLDDARREMVARLHVPDRATRRYRYDLCGTITIRSAQGTPEIHEVNSTGFLNDPDHRDYDALGTDDFTLFYLADPGDPQAAESTGQRSALCRSPVA